MKSWSEPSSKELLLCFGWLLHSTHLISLIRDEALRLPDIFSLLLERKRKSVDKQNLSSATGNHTQLQASCAISDVGLCHFESWPFTDQLQCIQHLVKNVEISSNSLRSLHVCNAKLNAQVRKS